jgi:asparagine synthase (glutamine-hydrolysing)
MCGIAGYVGTRVLDDARLDACLELMRRRGPDAAAYERWRTTTGRNVYLLNTRLAIVDLDPRANQPFGVGSKHLTYNGELYNHVELRDDLAASGHPFRTTSDTEVLLAAIERLGWDVLDRCEGMWALAVYDEMDGSLTISRDRFAEKPVYVHADESGVYFGSEPKLVFELLGRRLPVDEEQVRRYLAHGYRALYKSSATFFEGLEELPAATVMRVDADGRVERRSYWEPRFEPEDGMSYADAVDGARERLVRAVELRLRADVPVSFCMSGGVDSNALIAIARNVCGYDVHGFTVVTDDARYDERAAVEAVVAELGLRHTEAPVTTDGFLARMRELVRYHDAPVYTISYYAHWLLMELVAGAGYRVAVSGTGADELFSGYYDHHLAYLHDVSREPALHAAAEASWAEHVRPLVRNPYLRDPKLYVRDPGFRRHLFLDGDSFDDYLEDGRAEAFTERSFTTSLLRNRMLNELVEEVVPVILHEDDLNAMYFSVENRSPYLDRQLVEFCYRIPTRYLVRDGFAKAVLRDAVRGIAPDHVVNNRRKVGFNAPIFDFLDTRDAATRSSLLAHGPIFDYVRRDRVGELLDAEDLPNSASKFLFSLVSAKLFLEEFS